MAALSPSISRRPSISSRVSFAVSHAEQGEAAGQAPREGQIEEEIAEIKRYEVSECVLCHGLLYALMRLTVCIAGLYNDR